MFKTSSGTDVVFSVVSRWICQLSFLSLLHMLQLVAEQAQVFETRSLLPLFCLNSTLVTTSAFSPSLPGLSLLVCNIEMYFSYQVMEMGFFAWKKKERRMK